MADKRVSQTGPSPAPESECIAPSVAESKSAVPLTTYEVKSGALHASVLEAFEAEVQEAKLHLDDHLYLCTQVEGPRRLGEGGWNHCLDRFSMCSTGRLLAEALELATKQRNAARQQELPGGGS